MTLRRNVAVTVALVIRAIARKSGVPVHRRNVAVTVALVMVGLLLIQAPAGGAAGLSVDLTGFFPDGSSYRIEVPQNWNGTLFLYDHGYVEPGHYNPALDSWEPVTASWLLSQGYALAGSSYASTGWAVGDAETDQLSTIDRVAALAGRSPAHVITWGHSLGGLVALALAEEDPGKISGVLSMCSIDAGGARFWDVDLAAMVAFDELLAPGSALQLTGIADPVGNMDLAEEIAGMAQASAQGRARLALVAAIAGIPGWFVPDAPHPPTASALEAAQFGWLTSADLTFFADLRQELEQRAGGNFSTDAGFDFAAALAGSPNAPEVRDLYRSAHLSLANDLNRLERVPPIEDMASARAYIERYFSGLPSGGSSFAIGDISVPVLTMHTTGDGLVPTYNDTALSSAASRAGKSRYLRQVWVAQAGHCTFSEGETEAALETIASRVRTGRWPATDPASMNSRARHAAAPDPVPGPVVTSFMTARPAFVKFQSPPVP